VERAMSTRWWTWFQ